MTRDEVAMRFQFKLTKTKQHTTCPMLSLGTECGGSNKEKKQSVSVPAGKNMHQ